MFLVLNNKIGVKDYVETEKSLEQFVFNLVEEIRTKEPYCCINVNFGFDNAHIVARDTDFNIWIYNNRHILFHKYLPEHLNQDKPITFIEE